MDIKLYPRDMFHSVNARALIRPIKPLAEAVAPMIVAIIDVFEKILNPSKKIWSGDAMIVFLREETIEEEKDTYGILLACRRVNTYRLNKTNGRRTVSVRRTYYLSQNYCWIGNRSCK